MNKKKIMKRAWQIRREDSRNIFALCLKMAWEEARMEYRKALEIKSLVEEYGIYQERDNKGKLTGRMGVREVKKVQSNPADLERIKALKEDTIEYFRKETGADIEGLAEIREVERKLEEWNYKFHKSFEDVGGMGVGRRPVDNRAELMKKYPQAAAYLKADAMAGKSNYQMSAIGKRAKWEVIFGDYQKAMKDMEKELEAFREAHQWD